MTKDELKSHIASQYADKLTLLESGKFDPMYEIKPDQLQSVAKALRDDPKLHFDFLCNLGGVDTGEHLEVVYNIASTANKLRLDFKFSLPYDKPEVESVCEIWPGAKWYEREMWELYGINVRHHSELERFLLPDDWDQGNPMLKNWEGGPDFVRMPEL